MLESGLRRPGGGQLDAGAIEIDAISRAGVFDQQLPRCSDKASVVLGDQQTIQVYVIVGRTPDAQPFLAIKSAADEELFPGLFRNLRLMGPSAARTVDECA